MGEENKFGELLTRVFKMKIKRVKMEEKKAANEGDRKEHNSVTSVAV